MGQIKKLEERAEEVNKKLTEQKEANDALQKNLEGLKKTLEERDDKLGTANQVHACL